jgi:uncharacterized integral membrane protein
MNDDSQIRNTQPLDEIGEPSSAPTISEESPRSIPSTRAARTWARILPALVLLALTAVFVVQNPRDAKVTFLTFSGQLPLAIALLASAALGALVVLTLGTIRILQLRSLIRRGASTRARRDSDSQPSDP